MNSTRTASIQHFISIVAVALVASMMVFPGASTAAQGAKLTDGTSTETLASVSVADGGGSRLVLLQIALEPGTTIRAHSHSGPAVFTVISGALQTELIRGEAMVNRAGIEEAAEIGGMTYLYDGESIAFAPKAGVTIANQSDAPLLLVASILLETNEPVFDYDYWQAPSRPNLQ